MGTRKNIEDEGHASGAGFDRKDVVVFGLVIVILAVITYVDSLRI